MVDSCSVCIFGGDLKALAGQLEALKDDVTEKSTALYDLALMATRSAAEAEGKVSPAEQAALDRAQEMVLSETAHDVSVATEAGELISDQLSSAQEVNCEETGLDLSRVCPRLLHIAEAGPQIKDLLKKGHFI